MNAPLEHGYEAVRARLRAPRVVLVIDGDDAWESTAAVALYTAGRVWGGIGFVVVPHHGGSVNPELLRMVGFYDPDYVLTLQYSPREYEAIFPGSIFIDVDEETLRGDAALEHIGSLADDDRWPEYDIDGAREAILNASSAYRRRLDQSDSDWDEPLLGIHHRDIGGTLVPASSFPALQGPRLAVPDRLGGSVGLTTAMRCGFRARPRLPFTSQEDPSDLAGLIKYGLDGPRAASAPQSLCMFPDGRASTMSTTNAPKSWDTTTTGLIQVGPALLERDQTLVVFGDSSDDFALALSWDRMFGNGLWVPDAWMNGNGPERQAVHAAMTDRIVDAISRRRKILVTSSSLAPAVVDEYLESLRNGVALPVGRQAKASHQARRDAAVVRVDPGAVPFWGARHWACADQYDLPYTLPASIDDDGTVGLAAPVPDHVPTHPALQAAPDLEWQVDVEFTTSTMPTGRGLSGHHLIDTGDPWREWVRSGRDGTSYSSRSWGFIPAGASRHQQLARPQLRNLGLQAWVRARLADQHMAERLSPSGVRVEILRGIWGNRPTLVADLTESLRPLFLAFRPDTAKTADAYPAHDGVVLRSGRREGYLTYEAALRVLQPDLDEDAIRSELDRLLGLGVLRRGLILDCAQCDHKQFVTIDDLAQSNTCTRCRASNQLVQARWRSPAHEPRWFYELHAAVHDLLEQDGDVPLMAAHQLSTGARRFSAVSELELLAAGSAKPISEIDLVAVVDDVVIVGEAKRPSTLGTKKERTKIIRKLISVAQHLRADQIALCGVHAGPWPPVDIDELRQGITGATWPNGVPPRIRVIIGLGSQVDDQVHPAP